MAEIKTVNEIRRDFENYVIEVNGNEDMLNKWPSGSYKNPAVQGQYRGWLECAKRAAVLSANAGKVDEVSYRLLDSSDIIQADDEFIDDDGVRWMPIAGWEQGMRYSNVLKSGRRRIAPYPTQQAIDAGEV